MNAKNEQNDDFGMLPKKWAKIIKELPEFKEMADAASTDELKKMIVTAEGNIFDIEKAKEKDAELQSAREKSRGLAAPYNDAKNAQTAKIKYILFLLDEKGVDVGDKEE